MEGILKTFLHKLQEIWCNFYLLDVIILFTCIKVVERNLFGTNVFFFFSNENDKYRNESHYYRVIKEEEKKSRFRLYKRDHQKYLSRLHNGHEMDSDIDFRSSFVSSERALIKKQIYRIWHNLFYTKVASRTNSFRQQINVHLNNLKKFFFHFFLHTQKIFCFSKFNSYTFI